MTKTLNCFRRYNYERIGRGVTASTSSVAICLKNRNWRGEPGSGRRLYSSKMTKRSKKNVIKVNKKLKWRESERKVKNIKKGQHSIGT